MFRREIALELISCRENGSELGELYFEPAKRGGTYITVMLSGMEDIKSECCLCMKGEQIIFLPLPSPCQGKIELCLWSSIEMASVKEYEVSICDKNRRITYLRARK